jgi:hypothetical protein
MVEIFIFGAAILYYTLSFVGVESLTQFRYSQIRVTVNTVINLTSYVQS